VSAFKLDALFLSDIHLGSPHCQAEYLDAFLQQVRCEKLYLVGDIVDLWSLSRRFYWPKSHQRAWLRLQNLMQDSQSVYLSGNHDPQLVALSPWPLPALRFQSYSHTLRTGQQLLLQHGDTLPLPPTPLLLQQFGEMGYHSLMWAHSQLAVWQRTFGLGYWPLATFLKRLGLGRQYIDIFEATALAQLMQDNLHVAHLFGHIHVPKLLAHKGKYYFNTGDWVENCTAIFERDGQIELWRFTPTAHCLEALSL
jgi:UDP-2,3-diacylglucosamine pyrophosphatase LpxH